MKTVQQWWDQFALLVISVEAPPLQHKEMRRAFYAGFEAALMAGLEMANESGDDDDKGTQMMQALHDECHEFGKRVMEGKA